MLALWEVFDVEAIDCVDDGIRSVPMMAFICQEYGKPGEKVSPLLHPQAGTSRSKRVKSVDRDACRHVVICKATPKLGWTFSH